MNNRIFRAINQLAGQYRPIDYIMIFISKKARYLFLLLLIFMWIRNNFRKNIMLNVGISVGLTYFITFFIKQINFKPRPFLKHSVHLIPPFPSKKNSSFPSKHTTLAFALATSVFFYHRVIGWVMWLLAFLSGFSRIWMGQHYPSDIIGSAFLGSLTASFVKIFEPIWNSFATRTIGSKNR
ncbi:undecaprenyl-diphosphatase [Neobacillus bataviensis]|uniref:undecaprenyl-diphosphatase n=1 Tax=Neobacillus bataviensis TaxID=220685 RepID=UPI001CBD7CE1|nr:undecaprenyl-diphosphatase [Neobacillus bataviensis]